MDEFEDDMDATSAVYALRVGKTLTLQDYEAIQRFDAISRRDQERAVDAFNRGYEQGLSEGGGAEVAELKARIRELSLQVRVERGLRQFAYANLNRLRESIEARAAQDGEGDRG